MSGQQPAVANLERLRGVVVCVVVIFVAFTNPLKLQGAVHLNAQARLLAA